MSGSFYVRCAYFVPTKREVMEHRLGIRDMFLESPNPKRMTRMEFARDERKRRGPYWLFRNKLAMNRVFFSLNRNNYGEKRWVIRPHNYATMR